MYKHDPNLRNASRRIFIFGLLAAFAVPMTGSASTPVPVELAPFAAADDPDCQKSTVNLELDVTTGNVYLVNPDTGNLTLTDNDINVYFGTLGHVVVVLHYTSGEWMTTITPDGDPTVTYRTTNGWLRYSITDDYDQYVFHSSPRSTASTMSSMTPVVPDIVIRPKKDCPPSP